MPRKLLMGDLVLRCRRRADFEGDDTIKDPEWKSLISEQYGHLYSATVKAGMRHFEATQTITANGATSYALPADHDETIGIDRTIDSSGRTIDLDELMVQERNAWSGQTGDAVAYAVIGQSIVLYPRPLSGTYTHVYVPQSPDISSLADTGEVDVVTADGEAFLIYGVCVKAAAKRKDDTTLFQQERDAAEERFVEDVTLRALYNPRRRVVRTNVLDSWGDDFGLAADPASWRNR